ncbi:MAG: YHS domain-containing protein [Armatimonadota bacterium]
MKKTLVSIAVAIILAVGLVTTTAACSDCSSKKSPVKPPVQKKVVSAVCPVMSSKISDVTKAAGKSVYKGKTYYFCCAGCKPEFDKNPEKYINKQKK